MANASVTEANPREFFSFNGAYTVHPRTDGDDLLNDAACWIDSAKEIVNETAHELTHGGSKLQMNPRVAGKMLWGAFHLLQITEGAIAQVIQSAARSEVTSSPNRLGNILADAATLPDADMGVLVTLLRSMRNGMDMDTDSLRSASDEDLRMLALGGKAA